MIRWDLLGGDISQFVPNSTNASSCDCANQYQYQQLWLHSPLSMPGVGGGVRYCSAASRS
jgi:hypothetical protein